MPRSSIYGKFCQAVFGQHIEYDLAESKSSEKEKVRRLERTKILYKIVFKSEPDDNVWGMKEVSAMKIVEFYNVLGSTRFAGSS